MSKKDFNVSSYANMLKPDSESMKMLAKITLMKKESIDAIVDAPSEDEVKSALEALEEMKGDDGKSNTEPDE